MIDGVASDTPSFNNERFDPLGIGHIFPHCLQVGAHSRVPDAMQEYEVQGAGAGCEGVLHRGSG